MQKQNSKLTPLITNLGAEWQRKLTTLEVFNGRGFFKMPWDGASIVQTGLQGLRIGGYTGGAWNPKLITGTFWGAQLAPLDQAYAALRESVYQALLPQTRLKPYYDAINLVSRLVVTDAGEVQEYVRSFLDGGAGNDETWRMVA